MCGFAINRAYLVMLVLGLASAGCQWDVGTLDIRLVYAAGASDPFNPETTLIDRLQITVEGDGIHTRRTEFDLGGNRSGRLQNLPVGERVRVVVEGLDVVGTIGYRGVSSELTVRKGKNQLYLFFSRIGEFSAPPTVQTAIAPEWRERFRTVLRPGLGRAFHTASVLADGSVLVAGGTQTPDPADHLAVVNEGVLDSAEIFDPTSGAFLKDPAFCVDDDGDGWGLTPDCLGFDCNDADSSVTETCGSGCRDEDGDGYGLGDDCLGPDCNDLPGGQDCAIGACCDACPDGGLCMVNARAYHAALALGDGQDLLFLGGEPGGLNINPAEYFRLSEQGFRPTVSASMGQRSRQAAARVGLDRVVVAGGIDGAMEELGDIRVAGTNLSFNGVGTMTPARAGALGVSYPGGALIIGGWEEFSQPADRIPSASIERVRSDGDEVLVEHPEGLQLHLARAEAAVVVYTNPAGQTRILVCGGLIQNSDTGSLEPTDSCERIKPAEDANAVELLAEALDRARWGHTMTLLPDGNALVAGGFTQTFAGAGSNLAEIIDPQDGRLVKDRLGMKAGRGGHTATLMPNGMVLLVGGISAPGVMSSPGYEIYNP